MADQTADPAVVDRKVVVLTGMNLGRVVDLTAMMEPVGAARRDKLVAGPMDSAKDQADLVRVVVAPADLVRVVVAPADLVNNLAAAVLLVEDNNRCQWVVVSETKLLEIN